MGDPKSGEESSGSGVHQLFERGTAYWTEKSGAHFVSGSIFREYGDNRFERGFLGFPTNDEYPAGTGRAQEFQGGTISWTQNAGSHTLRYGTGIANTFAELGGARVLGAATSNETRSGTGVFQVFNKGTAYWSATSGSHFVCGQIFATYGRAGYERGGYGYPTSDEFWSGGGAEFSTSRGGRIAS